MPSKSPSNFPNRVTRRELLRRGSAASIALGTVASSGCLESLPTLGTSGPIEVPPADSPEYQSWLPASSALADDLALDPGHVIHSLPRQIAQEDVDGLYSFAELMIASQIDWFGYPYSHYDRALMIDRAFVLEGAIDQSAVESALSNTAYQPASTYEGYDLYDRSDIQRTVAVGDDAIVFSSDENSELNVKTVIDAGDGRIERYHEANDDFDRVLDASGNRLFNWFGSDETTVFQAISSAHDDEHVYLVHHRLYADEDAISQEELKEQYESGGWEIDPQLIEVHRDGRLAIVLQQFDREKYLGATSEHDWPQVTWGVEHDENAEQITLRHEAGDSIEAGLLSIRYGSPASDDVADTQFEEEYETVESGDELTLDLSTRRDTQQIYVSYSPDGDSKSLLIDYRIDR